MSETEPNMSPTGRSITLQGAQEKTRLNQAGLSSSWNYCQPLLKVYYLTASMWVTANSLCSLSKVPVTLTFLVSLQISLWKPLETSPVSL